VEIRRPFYLGVFPVTQAQWQAVMGSNPSWFSPTGNGKEQVKGLDTSDFPVEQVSWEDAQAFLERLTALPQEKEQGWQYRLPSEAEWEYSCRAGASSSTAFHFGSSLSSTQANFNYPYGGAEKGPYLMRPCRKGTRLAVPLAERGGVGILLPEYFNYPYAGQLFWKD
jgi:formylglycine-generating enzyme required for sulfatase activity